jgi:hypothetical protein
MKDEDILQWIIKHFLNVERKSNKQIFEIRETWGMTNYVAVQFVIEDHNVILHANDIGIMLISPTCFLGIFQQPHYKK